MRRPMPRCPPSRTDIPYEYEIVEYLRAVDSEIPCGCFEFTVYSTCPEEGQQAQIVSVVVSFAVKNGYEVLCGGHVVTRQIRYVIHPYGRTWFEYLLGEPYRQRVDVMLTLAGGGRHVFVDEEQAQ